MSVLPPLATRDRVLDAVLLVSCGIAQAAALAVAAFATRDAFAALHAGETLATRTVAELAVSGAAVALCLLLASYRAEALGQSYAISLRRALYQQIARLPKSRHEARRVGALSLRFVGDLSAARLWFGRGLPDVLSAAVVLPGAVAILFFLSPALAVSGLTGLGATLLLMCAVAWRLEHRHRRLRQRRANIAISMIERIAIAPELDLMGRTERELRKLDEQGASLRADALARRGKTTSLQAILQAGVAFSGLLMLWQAGQQGIAPAIVAANLSVLALVAMPLQDLSAAWDYYCAWRVARDKAGRLLSEPAILRARSQNTEPVSIKVSGKIGEQPVTFAAKSGAATTLDGKYANVLARCIAGLDADPNIDILYDGRTRAPTTAYVGDAHVGLQGSLRRSATLTCQRRPDDPTIARVLRLTGLGDLLAAPGGLDQRLSQNGHGLTAEHTLRLDLARAILGQADVIVIASTRWFSLADQTGLLRTLLKQSAATVILAKQTTGHNLNPVPEAV